jgi:hypothetical protein
MKTPTVTKGIVEARRLAKSGQTIAAASHLWRMNQPALGLGEAHKIVDGWGLSVPPMTTPRRQGKARVMWQNTHESESGETVITDRRYPTDIPVLVIDLDPATREALRERVARSIYEQWSSETPPRDRVPWERISVGRGAWYNKALAYSTAALRAIHPALRRKENNEHTK